MITMIAIFKRQLKLESLIYLRSPRVWLHTCLFFIMSSIFFALTLPPDIALLKITAPGLLWISLLLALFLSAEQIFQHDYDQGVLEQWITSGMSITIGVIAKNIAYLIFTLIPVLVCCPIFAILFHFNLHEASMLVLILILGTPTLVGLCSLAAAFGIGLQQKGMFMALVLFPLTIPLLIIGSSAITNLLQNASISGELALLLAFSFLTITCLPFAIAGVLKSAIID